VPGSVCVAWALRVYGAFIAAGEPGGGNPGAGERGAGERGAGYPGAGDAGGVPGETGRRPAGAGEIGIRGWGAGEIGIRGWGAGEIGIRGWGAGEIGICWPVSAVRPRPQPSRGRPCHDEPRRPGYTGEPG
jgi:hypothetical protein